MYKLEVSKRNHNQILYDIVLRLLRCDYILVILIKLSFALTYQLLT